MPILLAINYLFKRKEEELKEQTNQFSLGHNEIKRVKSRINTEVEHYLGLYNIANYFSQKK
tara:strand:+ start:520 stop:702 length:183 start_codon:yes stop_codon:yes gene_type:complete